MSRVRQLAENVAEATVVSAITAAVGAITLRVADLMMGPVFSQETDLKVGATLGFLGGLALASNKFDHLLPNHQTLQQSKSEAK